MLISFLMGHSLQGVSAKYTNELMIANSEALRDGAREDQPPDFRIARAHARRPSRCAACAGHADPGRSEPEKAQSRRSCLHHLRRGREGAGALNVAVLFQAKFSP